MRNISEIMIMYLNTFMYSHMLTRQVNQKANKLLNFSYLLSISVGRRVLLIKLWVPMLCTDTASLGWNTHRLVRLVPPGPDHSQHTRLWGALPAWRHSGHLHRPGVADVSHIISQWKWGAEGHGFSVLHSTEKSPANPKDMNQVFFMYCVSWVYKGDYWPKV